jgi:hypothetical protein
MRSCQEVSELVSKSLDVHLSLREWLAVRLHLMMCEHCSNFKKQMLFLHEASRHYLEYLEQVSSKKPR